MSLYVLKFGGSSVATPTRIKHVADIISGFVKKGHRVVVVTSAMQGVTNNLIELTKNFSDSPFNREYDAVISSGEQVAAGLLALALNASGFKAKSMNAWQLEIKTSGSHSEAEIIGIDENKIFQQLDNGIIPVITGFQGISENGDICTIGRGGSDATACLVTAAVKAEECLIYTDVDGVYTADPRVVLNAQKLNEISYDEMIELASWGAKVLQTQSVMIAKDCGINLRVLSTFSEGEGTKITNRTDYILQDYVAGITYSLDYFLLRANLEKSENLLKPYFKEYSQEAESKPIPNDPYGAYEFKLLPTANFLIPKAFQADAQQILTQNNIDFEIDNDVGIATVVGNLDAYIDEKDSMAFANYGKNLYDPEGKVLTLNEIYYRVGGAIYSNNIKSKQMIERDVSISVIVPFQQTIPFVNELHKLFFDEPGK